MGRVTGKVAKWNEFFY